MRSPGPPTSGGEQESAQETEKSGVEAADA